VRRLPVAACAVLALTACGSSGTSAQRTLRDTAKRLDDVRSAYLSLSMTATSPAAKHPVGFSMQGWFALPDKEGLPVANLEVKDLRGATPVTSTFVSTGKAAYVVRDGHAVTLPASAVHLSGKDAGLGTLRIDSWLRSPVLGSGGVVDNVPADHITAGLDVAAAFDDLGRLGERLGASGLAGLRPLDADAKARLAKSARNSTIEVWCGHKDHLLRRLVLTVTLGGDVPPALRSMVPVTLSLSLAMAAVNQPVPPVTPPAT
jgi:hypothetical protein